MRDELPAVITTSQLLASGHDRRSAARLVKTGELTRFGSGVHLSKPDVSAIDLARAAVLATGAGSVASHLTAARVHGLAGADGLPGMPGGTLKDVRPSVSIPSEGGVRTPRGLRVYRTPIAQQDIVSIDGVPVTSIARTLADLLLTQSREIALVAIEDAIYKQLIKPDCAAMLGKLLHHRPGAKSARMHLRQLDPRSRSPLETLSRLYFADRGLVAVAINAPIRHKNGVYLPDFIFESKRGRVIGEADGLRTHEGSVARAHDSLREEDLRHLGYQVVRWTWKQLAQDPDAIVARIRAWL